MIFPTPLHILLWLLLTFLTGAAALFEFHGGYWPMVAAFVCGLAICDGLLTLRPPGLRIERSLPGNLPVGVESDVRLHVRCERRGTLRIALHDLHPAQFRVTGLPVRLNLSGGVSAALSYRVCPQKRGHHHFPGVDVLVCSPLGMWRRKHVVACPGETRVFPNFREVAHYALLATHNHLAALGIKKVMRTGEGREFHQLREYRDGDELQKIDWKATSRYRRLISKDYQDERDQQIVFLLDCGRRMHHATSGDNHLDQALNSSLLLAHVAARQGDGVGMYAFGGVEKWLAPSKHTNCVRNMMFGVYDLQSSTTGSDYLHATSEVMALQKRRALIIVITNSRAEDHGDLIAMAKRLGRKHLVVVADLREEVVQQTSHAPVADFSGAVRYQALQEYLQKRKLLHASLSHMNTICLDVTAAELPAAIINSYLEVKNSARL